MPTTRPESTADLLMGVGRRIRRETARALEEWGITPSQARALRVVVGAGPVRPSVLASELRITPRSATEVVDALEAHGWVTRSADDTDRRATMVTPTDAGRALLERIEQAREESAARVLGVLGDDDRRTLDEILTRLGEQS